MMRNNLRKHLKSYTNYSRMSISAWATAEESLIPELPLRTAHEHPRHENNKSERQIYRLPCLNVVIKFLWDDGTKINSGC